MILQLVEVELVLMLGIQEGKMAKWDQLIQQWMLVVMWLV